MKRGFSLVELSIVLVILGLLTGGILAGQSLIRAAELRSVSTDLNRYVAATYTFRDKYMAAPGDMPNATAFWGAAAGDGTGNDTACHAVEGAGTATCNGNGDGKVYWAITSANGTPREYFTFWKHLANAGLIEGKFTGISGSGSSNNPVTGINTPQLRLQQAAIRLGHTQLPIPEGHASSYAGYYGFNWAMGRPVGTADDLDPIFLPEEVWNIDMKMDDGNPATGRITVMKPAAMPGCALGNDASTARYDLTTKTQACRFTLSNVI